MARVRIKMLKTKMGSEDGFTVNKYEEGKTLPVEESLAAVFVKSGWAEWVSGRVRAPEAPSSTDDEGGEVDPTESGGETEGGASEGNDGPAAADLEDKPSTWVGKVLINPDGEERTVEKVNGNQVFFLEEDQSTDYRVVRRDYRAKE